MTWLRWSTSWVLHRPHRRRLGRRGGRIAGRDPDYGGESGCELRELWSSARVLALMT